MPTFHHWKTGEHKFGLTFLTAADARHFDHGVKLAVDDLLDGEFPWRRGGSSGGARRLIAPHSTTTNTTTSSSRIYGRRDPPGRPIIYEMPEGESVIFGPSTT